MKRNLLLAAMLLTAGSLIAADDNAVMTAAKNLAGKDNYGWKTTTDAGGGGGGNRFRPGPTEGKTEKGGFTSLSMSFGDNTTEAVLKGEKGALKTDDGWQSLTEAAGTGGGGGQPNPSSFLARRLQTFKAPAAEAESLAAKTKELKEADGAFSGDLTEAGAKELLSFGGRRGGGAAPNISDAKGSVKFWLKDGLLAKYQYKVSGTVSFNGNDRDVDRTTTVEIKKVGETKVEVSDEAKKKLE